MKGISKLSESIQQTIDDFVISDEPQELREIAKDLNVLPLVPDWGHNWSLNADFEVICFSYDEPREVILIDKQKEFQAMRRRVFLIAATNYPKLEELMPKRPSEAIECPTCQGKKINPINQELGFEEERIGCTCFGLGWILESEQINYTISNYDEFFGDSRDK